MNERDIFLAAIEIADPAGRATYVAQACGADARLRAQVDQLLRTHEQSGPFIETPVVATNASTIQTIVTDPYEADQDDGTDRALGESEFRKCLQPTDRPGWLGRLAHYEVESILGRGAFGIVAKAFDTKLHRVVAIKLMHPELASTSPPRKRFLREARTAAAVTHENIVAIYAVEEEPIPYLVMEYIPGQTLQQRMDQNGPLEVAEVLRIGQQVASGLAAAHAVNLIHRDIKPSNILLSDGPSPRAKISDFGLARAIDDASLTSSGLIAGTPMYMAPEQARGETLDHRADLFSLGSVLYQVAGGRPPFRADSTLGVLKRVCEDTPRSLIDVLPGIPRWLETIIFRLLEKQRDDRFQTAQEVADLLARCQRELEHNGKVTCVAERSSAPESQIVLAQKPTGTGATRKQIGWLVGGVIAVSALTGIALMNGKKPAPDPSLTTSSADTSSASTSGTPTNPTTAAGWPADTPPPAISPFDAEQAKAHQEAWAKHLGVPVEYENSIGMKFRLIPPGEFTMGRTRNDAAALAALGKDEHWQAMSLSSVPEHRVRLTKAFYLGACEVTQTQYEQVMGVNPSYFSAGGEGKDSVIGVDTKQFPVEMVSFVDAAEFCIRLSHRENRSPVYSSESERDTIALIAGDGYRLPTEAEWEYAARAGTNTTWIHGEQESTLGTVAWYSGNSGGMTHSVGQLMANQFGLYDVHGNVGEWCQDWYDAQAYSVRSIGLAVDPRGPIGGSMRMDRGSGWAGVAASCQIANRNSIAPRLRRQQSGFRLALPVDAVRPVLANNVTVRRLLKGRFEVAARDYRAEIGATGLIEEVSSGETTLIEATSFGGMGRAESGPVTATQEGTTLTFSQGDEYRLTYAFRPDGYTILARVSTAAAGRDGIDGKPGYLPHISRFSASAKRVVPEDGLPPFDLPATKEEESYTCRFNVEFDSGAHIEVHSAPGEHSGFIFPGGPMAWGRVNLQLDTDNELRFDVRR